MIDQNLRALVRGAYALQKLRIQTGNRVVANFKVSIGQEPSRGEETLSAEAKLMLATLRKSHKLLTEGLTKFPRPVNFKGDEVISKYTELCLVHQYVGLEKEEVEHFKRLEASLDTYPIYETFLKGIKGIGKAMAGVILSEMDPHEANYPSSFWAYAGLDVGPDGKGRSRRKEHLVEKEYTDREGEVKMKNSITFNPWLKTKLIGVLGPSFLKAKSPYAERYREYKARLENHVEHKEKTAGHRHNMAVRYMVKRFLIDLHMFWRKLEGLEVTSEYSEGKLGMKHKA